MLNWDLLANPINWVIVFLMIAFALIAGAQVNRVIS